MLVGVSVVIRSAAGVSTICEPYPFDVWVRSALICEVQSKIASGGGNRAKVHV